MSELVENLKSDHRSVEKMRQKITATEDISEREVLLAELSLEFNVHATAEEQVLYPELHKFSDMKELIAHSVDERDEAWALLEPPNARDKDCNRASELTA